MADFQTQKEKQDACDHDWHKEYMGGMATGDDKCPKCDAERIRPSM